MALRTRNILHPPVDRSASRRQGYRILEISLWLRHRARNGCRHRLSWHAQSDGGNQAPNFDGHLHPRSGLNLTKDMTFRPAVETWFGLRSRRESKSINLFCNTGGQWSPKNPLLYASPRPKQRNRKRRMPTRDRPPRPQTSFSSLPSRYCADERAEQGGRGFGCWRADDQEF